MVCKISISWLREQKFQRWAPLNSSVICHQTIDNKVPTNIICNEDHKLNLLSNHTYGSRTQIKQEFQLIREEGLNDALHYPGILFPVISNKNNKI